MHQQSGVSGAKGPKSGGIVLEEAAKVIGGVTGELLFFARSFLLGFLLRLSYEPLILVRKLFRHPKLVVDVQDILFWTVGSFLMFGLLFRENNGTPRLFSLVGILAGMILYQLGPGRLTGALFNKLRRKSREWKRIYQEKRKGRIQKRKERIQKHKDRIQKHKDRIQKRKDRLQEQKVAARQQKKHRPEAKNEKKRLKKEQKDSMIKRQDEHSRNKRGEDSDRKNGSPQESQSQVDRTGTRDSDPRKRDDLDRRKQSGRAKRTEPGAAKAPRRADRKGRGAQRRT